MTVDIGKSDNKSIFAKKFIYEEISIVGSCTFSFIFMCTKIRSRN
ncbi:hypothetical protein FIC_00382 [Flavobacteriaceae bacterium 3519-10]|nr:hypothetical protein FIC_00382 [Flavobacteriaceae bacterium 3519-10]